MTYVDCEVVDCKYQFVGKCVCFHVIINKIGNCESYKSRDTHYKWKKDIQAVRLEFVDEDVRIVDEKKKGDE